MGGNSIVQHRNNERCIRQGRIDGLAVEEVNVKELGYPRSLLRFMGYGLSGPFVGRVKRDDQFRLADPEVDAWNDIKYADGLVRYPLAAAT